MLERLQALPRRWRWLGTVMAVQERFGQVQGPYLAAAVTLAAFLSVFPLLLVAIAVVGFFSSGTPDLADDVLSFLGLPEGGDAARVVTTALETAEKSKRTASIVGLAGLLWAGLALLGALQHAYNSVWQVSGRGWRGRLIGVAWLAGAAVLFTGSFALTAVVAVLPTFLAPVNVLAGLAVGLALFLWTSRVLCNRDVGWRPLLPGAIAGALGLEVLKFVGGIYLPRAVARSSALYGSIGAVFAVLAWLFVFGRLLVYAAVLNVVLWERERGTVTVEVEVPRLPGVVPLTGTRSGATEERDDTPAPR